MLRSSMLQLLVGFLAALCEVKFCSADPLGQELIVTYDEDRYAPHAFQHLPTTESEAISEGFIKFSEECSAASGKFLGHRYIREYDLDPAAVLIYDARGRLAGIQSGFPKYLTDQYSGVRFSYERSPAYQLDKVFGFYEVYFLTAYFVDPRSICDSESVRDTDDATSGGVGLYLQNGTNPYCDTVRVPYHQEDMRATKWVEGSCVDGMGFHYYYDVNKSMDCQDFFPYTVMYNGGKLTVFAFYSFGNYTFSDRFEHLDFEKMTNDDPQCVMEEYNSAGGCSDMHTYFKILPQDAHC